MSSVSARKEREKERKMRCSDACIRSATRAAMRDAGINLSKTDNPAARAGDGHDERGRPPISFGNTGNGTLGG